MSLYRKYRPQSLADVVGQDHVVRTLEEAARQDKLAHAYLFAGSRGTGKTSIARILAKVLMTHGVQDEKIRQQIGKGVEEGSLVDLLEIDAASNRGIDDIRDLIEKIQFSPVVASAKVYIIDEVHMLTKEAFNALLKTLEEPPPYAFFILATTEIQKIPETIQSRCQRFPFHRIREEDIVRRLQYIADQERITVDREALRAIARHVEGGMRDAISLLDQMQSLPTITLEDVEARIGGTGHEHVATVMDALTAGNSAAIVEAVRQIEDTGVPFDVFLRQLLKATRERMHADIEAKKPAGAHLRMLQALLDAMRTARFAPVPGLAVEAALLSLCAPAAAAPAPSAPAARHEPAPVPQKIQQQPVPEKTEKKEELKEESPLAGALINAPELSLASLQSAWPGILTEIGQPAVKMSIKNGSVRALEENKRVILSFSSAFHRDKVADTKASRHVEEIMEKIFKRSLHLECVLESEHENAGGAGDESVNLADAAAEIF